MTIEQKIFSKLEPHAKRIQDGNGNDFDYLPAVLLQLIEGQKRQATQIEDTAKLLDSLQSATVAVGLQTKEQIAAFDSATQSKLQQLETALQDAQIKFQSSQSMIREDIAVLSKSHALHAVQTTEGLSAIGSKITSFADDTQQAHVKIVRFLIAGLVTSTVIIGLAIAILQRH
jgi:DNA-binding transcriptional MerR regulator